MNKKSLSIGMIIPLAAVGAIATAPTASAEPSQQHHNWVKCDLQASALRGPNIKVVFALHSSTNRGVWKVVINKNHRTIDADWLRTNHHGYLTEVDYTYDGRGTDWFSATAYNPVTHQQCSDKDVVFRWERFSR